MIKAGIIGGAGYTGGETLRLLLDHPEVELSFVQSESQTGKKVYEIHKDCFGATELQFQKEINDVDVLFLCKAHGESKLFLKNTKIPSHTKIIDLSQDFRHKASNSIADREFVYGLPELNFEKIKKASSVANPGCFATCIQLALLPLIANGKLKSNINVSATTGSTGAGQSFSETAHFSWRSNNHSAYKVLEHQHEKEITESILQLDPNYTQQLYFVPQRGAFTRGIYATVYLECSEALETIEELFKDFYKDSPFTKVVPFDVDVKLVVNTNNCFISLQNKKDQLIVNCVIDNLLKGAAGQAVHNMNLMFGLNETEGLKLKPIAF